MIETILALTAGSLIGISACGIARSIERYKIAKMIDFDSEVAREHQEVVKELSSLEKDLIDLLDEIDKQGLKAYRQNGKYEVGKKRGRKSNKK